MTYLQGKLPSFNDEPVVIKFYENGTISKKIWYKNGNYYRVDKYLPVYIEYDTNGYDFI
jgi:hypothetical protein